MGPSEHNDDNKDTGVKRMLTRGDKGLLVVLFAKVFICPENCCILIFNGGHMFPEESHVRGRLNTSCRNYLRLK